MSNEQWLARKVLEQEELIVEKDRKIADLRELFQAQTLACAHLADDNAVLLGLLAGNAQPVVDVADQFPSLVDFMSCEQS